MQDTSMIKRPSALQIRLRAVDLAEREQREDCARDSSGEDVLFDSCPESRELGAAKGPLIHVLRGRRERAGGCDGRKAYNTRRLCSQSSHGFLWPSRAVNSFQ